jgi:hypothetical protein
MTIVAVNGGGNTPQGAQLERCFVKSWSTSGDADGLPTKDGLLLPTVPTDDAVKFTAIAMAESGGNTEAHNPHGEDSLGLWQINVEPTQPDVNPDTFDSSELVQWASGTALATETLTTAHEGLWLI